MKYKCVANGKMTATLYNYNVSAAEVRGNIKVKLSLYLIN
jgi:hypothetical protein